MTDLAEIFASGGALESAIRGYRLRPQQLEMAEAIERTIDAGKVLIAEAGTGTGKTVAYLVPALRSGGKVIISTGTKTLQDQLFHRDLPAVRDALRIPVTVSLLKGRANYVCLHHLEAAVSDGRFLSRDDAKYVHLIKRFADASLSRGKSGDRAELFDVPEKASVWAAATSSRENCLGSQCRHYADCFVMKARKAAHEAEVVVVNHHLFFADLVLRDEGVADLLPACNTVIFDEAHQLPETASLFFGEALSTAQLIELAHDARIAGIAHAKEFTALPEACLALDRATRDLRIAVKQDAIRLPEAQIASNQDFKKALDALQERLSELRELLESQSERAQELLNCLERADDFAARLVRWRDITYEGYVRWMEVFQQSLVLNLTPLSIAEPFQRQIEGVKRAWIFTSATLAVKDDFRHYQRELGLLDEEKVATAGWASPFDYQNQALMYVPEGLPDPNAPGYTEAVIEAALPVIRASKGRAFLLFTSLRALDRAAELLDQAWRELELPYALLKQGQGSRSELLERFRAEGNAVLLGSQSFWEGVDVKGEALSLVVIDKLPFAPPDDPVMAARIDAINTGGGNAFFDYQLPHAIISLKQGAGRLIRDEEDRGVLMICDPRIITKAYGKRIWQSLPPMKRTRSRDEAQSFFARPGPAGGSAQRSASR
jgi:ATP-dependent DNA helicase DinG